MPAAKVWTGYRWDYEVPVSAITDIVLNDNDTDQTASLLAQLADIPDGANEEDIQVARLPVGDYRLDGKISILHRNWLNVEGPTAGRFRSYTDTAGDSDRAHWEVGGGAHIQIRGFDIWGSNNLRDAQYPAYAAYSEAYFGQHGVSVIGGAEDVLVENMTITQIFGDFLYTGAIGAQSLNVTYRNIVGRYAGRQALGITNVDGLLCEDLDLMYNGRSGMDIEPNHDTHFVDNVIMRRCTIGSKFYPFIIGGSAGDTLFHVGSVELEDCVGATNPHGYTAVLANARKHSLIVRRHTDIHCRSTQCITVGLTDQVVTIDDCTITSGPSTPTSYGVMLGDCAAVVVLTDNNFSGTGGATTGADQLYGVQGTIAPASVTHCGNVWAGNTANDGVC